VNVASVFWLGKAKKFKGRKGVNSWKPSPCERAGWLEMKRKEKKVPVKNLNDCSISVCRSSKVVDLSVSRYFEILKGRVIKREP